MKGAGAFLLAALVLSACQTAKEENTPLSIRQLDPVRQYSSTQSAEAARQYSRGVELQSAKDYRGALAAYLRAIELDARLTDAMDNAGVCYRILEDYANAKKYYEMSLRVLPDNDVALMNLALVCRATGEKEKALELYGRMIELDRGNPEGYYGLGSVYQEIGDYEQSIVNLEISIEKYAARASPYVYDAYAAQGFNNLRLGEWERALFYL
jgi:tetratricopeptide (TPR) repeat protein